MSKLKNIAQQQQTLIKMAGTTAYNNLKLAVDSKSPQSSYYYFGWSGSDKNGMNIVKVLAPDNKNKFLLLRVENLDSLYTLPPPNQCRITGYLKNSKTYVGRADHFPRTIPRNITEEEIDGTARITFIKEPVAQPPSSIGSNPGDLFKPLDVEEFKIRKIIVDSGAFMNLSSNGLEVVNEKGESVLKTGETITSDVPHETTLLEQGALLIQSFSKKQLAIPETMITPLSWEYLPDIPKIIKWANIGGLIWQVYDKVSRIDDVVKRLEEQNKNVRQGNS